MELPCRSPGDELLPAGELTDIRRRLRRIAGRHDLATVIACAFDHRTRMLPFIYADLRMVPAGARAVGSAMADAGFERTRIVLQQWNRNFRPSRMRLDGRVPDLFLVSSMQIHAVRCRALIRDADRIEPGRRPLIVAGGPKTIYEPWDVFGADPSDPWGADVAVTGEEYVLLNLLEVLLSVRAAGEPMRSAFMRARDEGALDEVPGLVYARTDSRGVTEELVDTGVQRLAGDLDELPHPVLGYRLLERPGRGETLADHALPASRIRKVSPIGSLVLTFGCKFTCPYCPIPAYNQRQFRAKSGERIADEMRRLHAEYGLRQFFGTDDNFFNDRGRTLEIVETLARAEIDGAPLRRKVRWATEVTVADTLRIKEHLPTVRKAGVRMLWLGVEDMTATFIRKGQSVSRTTEAFRLLTDRGILPVPMLMHHDGQPLYSPGSAYGLLNQVRLLRKAGAIGLQVLMMTPAAGSKQYEEAFTSGLVYDSAGGRRVEPHMYDANYVIASGEAKPWRKQVNILLAYLYFYNPLRLLIALVRPRSSLYLVDVGMQAIGMYGLAQTIRRTFGWALRLMRGNIRLKTAPPAARVLIRGHLRSFPHSPRPNVHSDVP
jgi:radical SAM superfamily enzyme YgiQ (UPF0313 family)